MSLYISGGNKIGFEFRKNETVNDHKNFTVNDVNLADNQWHTITLVTEKDSYYKVYLDQKLVQQWDVSETNCRQNGMGTDFCDIWRRKSNFRK